MPRRPRRASGQIVFHVLNRAVQGLVPFEQSSDYEHFLRLLRDTSREIPMRLLAYTLMPNHWHLVLWPGDDNGLSRFMMRLTATHAQQWRTGKGSVGRGAVYQGRFKAIAVQNDFHFLRVCRYVERNPLRARLAASAEDWPWSSASRSRAEAGRPELAPWPVPRPDDWPEQLNVPEPSQALSQIRDAIRLGRHFGSVEWRSRTARALKWRSGGRGPGRCRQLPRVVEEDTTAEHLHTVP